MIAIGPIIRTDARTEGVTLVELTVDPDGDHLVTVLVLPLEDPVRAGLHKAAKAASGRVKWRNAG